MPSNEPGLEAAPPAETPGPDQASSEFERADPRVPFVGFPIQIRAGALRCSIRLRDLSCGGASGLCDEALDVGAFITVCLAKAHEVEAEVRWVRMMNVGLKFTDPLPPSFVRKLHQTNGAFVTTRSGK